MDRVSEWMREHDLEVYIEKFEEQGWDTLPVLLEMTESDIEMCIQKPGHKAKFKRALRYLKSDMDISNDENLHLGSVKAFCDNERTIKPDNQGDSSIENTISSQRHPETYDTIKQSERVQVEQEDSGNVESGDEMVG